MIDLPYTDKRGRRNPGASRRGTYRHLSVRTSNDAEAKCVQQLEADGWEVMKRGWPDFLAVRDGVVRMIEVKPRSDRTFSPAQRRVAEVLSLLGVEVELWHPPESP